MSSKLSLIPLMLVAAACTAQAPPTLEFADRIETLSGAGGYFDTDNLISNERSYLHAISDLRAAGIKGGAYLGVGPDQNFSYIAEIDPRIAIIVDIRPDNILQHLLYKALFHAARNRTEYLALMTGRPVPDDIADWTGAPLDSVLGYIETQPSTTAAADDARRRVAREVEGFGVALTDGQRATLARFHDEFIELGLQLRFRSHGRAPQFYYPTYGELLSEVDREGEPASYVATEDRWARVRALQLDDRVLPIAGDLGGPAAFEPLAEFLNSEGLEVTAFYTSNVEFYLFGDRTFATFIDNLEQLPLAEPSVIIKSFFRGFRGQHPLQVPGYYSTQLVQDAGALLDGWDSGRFRTYWEVVTEELVEASPVP